MATDGISLDDIVSALIASGDPDPWVPGITPLSLMSPQDQEAHLGVTPPPGEATVEEAAANALLAQAQITAEAIAAVSAPAAYDLRSVGGKNYVTTIKDQKSCGSCVAFGTVATVESTLRVQRGDPSLAVDLSEAQLFFCHARARGRSCSTGWWPNEAFDDFKSKGVADDACYPYNLSNTDCSGLCSNWADRVVKITGYQNLTSKPAQIKQQVSTKGPVCACFAVYEDFFSYKSGVYKHKTGALRGGHCVTIVGYNDNPGYWICKNSSVPGLGGTRASSRSPTVNAQLTPGSITALTASRTLAGRPIGVSLGCGPLTKTVMCGPTLTVSAGGGSRPTTTPFSASCSPTSAPPRPPGVR